MNQPDVDLTSIQRGFENFFDSWNLLGMAIGVVGIVTMFSWFGVTTQTLLVAITVVYAFISFNQMREARRSRNYPGTLVVRPAFRWDENRNGFDFGLENFGNGPAINLGGCAIVRDKHDEGALEIRRTGAGS